MNIGLVAPRNQLVIPPADINRIIKYLRPHEKAYIAYAISRVEVTDTVKLVDSLPPRELEQKRFFNSPSPNEILVVVDVPILCVYGNAPY